MQGYILRVFLFFFFFFAVGRLMNHGQGSWGPIRYMLFGFLLLTIIASRNVCELTRF
jgi:hypothetical protein